MATVLRLEAGVRVEETGAVVDGAQRFDAVDDVHQRRDATAASAAAAASSAAVIGRRVVQVGAAAAAAVATAGAVGQIRKKQ